MNARFLVFFSLTAAPAVAFQGSAVQKVIELLGECKAKVLKDLDAETAAMKEYTAFCDNEVKDKMYAIETAGRGIEEAKATISDATATIATAEDEIATLGTHIAAKETELSEAQKVRAEANANFVAAEKELLTSVDQLGRAVQVLKKGSFLQGKGGHMDKKSFEAIQAIGTMIESQWVTAGSRKTLKSFLQSAAQAKESEDDEFSLDQPQAKQVAYESSSGGIIQTVEEMQGKAEDTLSELRKKEMSESQEFQMLEGGLKNEISHGKSKLSANTKLKAESQQASEEASGELTEVEKTKAADEAYVETMKQECQAKAVEYEETMKSGQAEIAAIGKATTILEEGVTAFVEVSSRVHRSSSRAKWTPDDDDESDDVAAARQQVVSIFKGIAQSRHSFVFTQLAAMAASDPFAKIKGLINDMIEKLLKEAQEEATHEAFCQEEMGKSKASQADKQMKLDKFSTRVDEGESKIAELTESIKTLEAEIAEIDKGQAEATAIRTKENEEFSKVSKDYKDSATAVAKAIEVLQSFYSGAALVQIKSTTMLQSQVKAHAKGNGDAANVIIGVLEVAQEDFTSLLAESEAVESESQTTYDKMTTENKIAKASKSAEAKAKASELKSVGSSLEMSKEDQASTSKELDAVNAYIDKLKPECESKAMSYEEKKAAREAEIEGLKDALSILSGKGVALAQTGHFLKRIHRV
jgi:chromosome segregation ATPase